MSPTRRSERLRRRTERGNDAPYAMQHGSVQESAEPAASISRFSTIPTRDSVISAANRIRPIESSRILSIFSLVKQIIEADSGEVPSAPTVANTINTRSVTDRARRLALLQAAANTAAEDYMSISGRILGQRTRTQRNEATQLILNCALRLNNQQEDALFVNRALDQASSNDAGLPQLNLIRARCIRFIVNQFIRTQQNQPRQAGSSTDVARLFASPAILPDTPLFVDRSMRLTNGLLTTSTNVANSIRHRIDQIISILRNDSSVTAPRAPQPRDMATMRLRRDLCHVMRDPPENCTVEVDENNMFHWSATINGPADTPYENGVFRLSLTFPRDYPFSPPKVYFITKIYHCNINDNGFICLNILSNEWSPALTVSKILVSIMSLLSDPNPRDPLQASIAVLYQKNRNEHDRKAREWTARFAKPLTDTGSGGNVEAEAAVVEPPPARPSLTAPTPPAEE